MVVLTAIERRAVARDGRPCGSPPATCTRGLRRRRAPACLLVGVQGRLQGPVHRPRWLQLGRAELLEVGPG
ncbi:MAG: hypothetical protein R3F60_31755 [bacterium]